MPRFPLFGTEQKGRSSRYTSQQHINVYAERTPDGDRSTLTFYGRPGLELFTEVIEAHPSRGMRAMAEILYTVHRDVLYSVNLAGVVTVLGTLNTTTGKVDMTDNGTELLVVDGEYGYIYNVPLGTFAVITDCNFPKPPIGPVTCDFQGGYFLISKQNSGEWNISKKYKGTIWDALEFANAEGFPDNLVRVIVERSEVVLFGENSTEYWQNVGDTDFPFQRVGGGAVEWGLAARWSVADIEGTVCFLARNRTGEVRIVRLNGYQAQAISDAEVNNEINSYDVVEDASGVGYTSAGHIFYQINFPAEGVSWMFDNNANMWMKLEYSAAGARHRVETGTIFGSQFVAGDYENGNLYRINSAALDDAGVSFAKEIVSRHVAQDAYLHIARIWADFEPGVGLTTGQGSDPQAMLQVSKDGGHSWGPERWVSIGKIGEYMQRAIWRRLGRAYSWVIRIRVSDPVKFVLTGAWMDAS